MLQRINIVKIIIDHFKTLKRIDSQGDYASIWDVFLFVIVPLAISVILTISEVSLSNHITDLITSVSIIGGFLFNLLAIIYGLMDKLEQDALGDPLKKVFVKEVHVNISFNILISLFLLSSLILYSYLKACYNTTWQNLFYSILTGLIYFLLILFLVTMFMILNRIYILLKK